MSCAVSFTLEAASVRAAPSQTSTVYRLQLSPENMSFRDSLDSLNGSINCP